MHNYRRHQIFQPDLSQHQIILSRFIFFPRKSKPKFIQDITIEVTLTLWTLVRDKRKMMRFVIIVLSSRRITTRYPARCSVSIHKLAHGGSLARTCFPAIYRLLWMMALRLRSRSSNSSQGQTYTVRNSALFDEWADDARAFRPMQERKAEG